jgi:hypothetical protein
MLKEARRMPKKTPEEKALRAEAIKTAKNVIKETKERNLAIERAPIIIEDLNKFSTATGKHRIFQAEKDLANGLLCPYSNAKDEMSKAKKLPHKTAEEKEIRSNAIKNARVKKEAAALIRKHGKENITAPDAGIKEELLNREHQNFLDSMKTKREISRYMKKESVYRRAIKPYTDAELLLAQAKDYEHYDELLTQYEAIK